MPTKNRLISVILLNTLSYRPLRFSQNNQSFYSLGKIGGLCLEGQDHGIPYQGVPVGTIKKHMTDKGNASKEEVIAAVREKGHEPKDDNEADAIALLYWRLNCEKRT